MANDLSLARKLIRECQETQNPELDLGNCGIEDLENLPELFKCKHLQSLNLNSTWWTSKKGTRTLSKSVNQGAVNTFRSIPIGIVGLKNLKHLIIGGYNGVNLDNLHLLGELNILQSLDLSGAGILHTGFLAKLTNLQYLNLQKTEISDVRFLKKLINLKFLDLSLNRISDIRFLERLTNLESLYMSDNEIANVFYLKSLTKLSDLSLGTNKIVDLSFLELLTDLQFLYLGFNNISNLHPLENLLNLRFLYLSHNNISDIQHLKKLTSLRHIELGNNKISDVSILEKLTGLKSLDLRNNQIQIVPQTFFQGGMAILSDKYRSDGLNLYGNPIESPPLEIIEQGKQSVLDWFEAAKKKLNEIKIILIGDPKSGKTSVLRRLRDDSFDDNEAQTDGINIEDICFGDCPTFEGQKSLHKLTAHFWDFGGQEIMNATHQFFLTNRSVYLLVLDARKDNNIAGQIRQWVKKVKATGGNSPIIVIANQADINSGFGFTNGSDLQNEFPAIRYFIKASCKTGEGINEIKEKLAELIPKAELFNTEIDERWIAIKKQLQEETGLKRYLDETRFKEICNEHGINDKQGRLNAIRFFNDLGLLLHFEELDLAQYYVLDPYWITCGVYQIVTSGEAGRLKGIVPMDRLEYIVNEEEDKKDVYKPARAEKIEYDVNQRRFLVDILNQFKLCFYLPGNKGFIIPGLLDTEEPVNETQRLKNAQDSIRFVYKYEYMPNSVLPNIMVAAHPLLGKMWRTGCVLEGNGCKALVSAYQDVLTITVNGEGNRKREFMAVVRHCIDTINQGLAVKPQMLVPLPGITPIAYAEYEVLLAMENESEKYFYFDRYKPTKKQFEISVLLEGIAKPDELKVIMEGILDLQDSMVELKTMLNVHYQYLIQRLGDDNIDGKIIEAIREIDDAQTGDVKREILESLSDAFEIFSGDMDGKLKTIYDDLKKTDNLEMKLKLSIPFLNLLGIELGTEVNFDVKSWAIKMYKKHKLRIFELLGAFPASE